MATQILNFQFNINGTEITFSAAGVRTTLSFCPLATCNLFKELGAVEDFAIDRNGEPVVLHADENEPVGYGYSLWYQFVKEYPFSLRTAEIILEHRERREASISFHAIIKTLQAA